MTNEFNTGARVSWTETVMRVSKKGTRVKASSRTGKVISIDGDVCIVRYRGKELKIHKDNLRLDGQKSELTEMVENMAK